MENLTKGETPLIVIVSNRGPFQFTANKDGSFDIHRGAGGLVTALTALAETYDVLWVAAAMSDDDSAWAEQHEGPQNIENIHLKLIQPDPERYRKYYNVIANPMLWFIHHQLWDTTHSPSITEETWDAWQDGYGNINKQIADAVATAVGQVSRPVIVMPQDYHLYLVPYLLRQQLGDTVQIQPFLHIPWPGPDAWRILPSQIRNTILTSLLHADRIGFQTQKDAFNFVQTCRFYLTDAHSHGSRDTIHFNGRSVKATAFPISVDVEKIKSLTVEPQTHLLKSQLMNMIGDRQMILRVDRIEPSKNILRGLEAYEALLEAYPEHRSKVQLVMLLVPSRMGVSEYQDYFAAVMSRAGLINAKYSDPFWEPVRVIVGDNYHRAIAAMQLYDVLLVNPLADGMNLVAKEGVLVNQRNGSLLLSEHAGAYYELQEYAHSVSPFDIFGTSKMMHEVLTMDGAERARRAAGLRKTVESNDVRLWFQNQVDAARQAWISQSRKISTPATSSTKRSAAAMTPSGVSVDKTPTATV